MTWQIGITLATVALMVIGLARNWAAPDIVLTAALTILMGIGIVGPNDAIAGFGSAGLVTVAVLFVVTAGLTETGGMSLVSRPLLGQPKSEKEAQVRMALPVMTISAFLNNTPVVAMFVPVIQDWGKKTGLAASKLLLPLSYMAILGGICTLIGTSTNLVVNGLLIDAHKTNPEIVPMGMFTLTAVGLPIAAVGFLYLLTMGSYLLPDRRPQARDLADVRQYTVEMSVERGSAVDGLTVEQAGLRHLPGLYLLEIDRNGEVLVAIGPEQVLRGGDRLIFVGLVESIVDLQKIRGLVPATDQIAKLSTPRPERCLVEAVLSPNCSLVGKTPREARFRSIFDAAIIAVHRQGERIRQKIGEIELQPGDTLLVEAHPGFVDKYRNDNDFLLISAVAQSTPLRHDKAGVALAILLGLVVCVGLEWTNILVGGFVAGGLMLALRCCSAEQARRSIDWSILIAIGSAIGVGRALEQSGAAHYLATGVIGLFEPFGPWGALAAIFLITMLLTEFLTNNAAAVLVFPIAKATAFGLGVDMMPFAVAIAIAASCAFAMPLGYQTHLMVYGAGGYRVSDFLRVGLLLDVLVAITAVTLIPIVYPF